MPALTRFSGKFPESADYPVAVIVSCPTRIHKKERSFNFVNLRWKKTGRERAEKGGLRAGSPVKLENPEIKNQTTFSSTVGST
jgi:hypothetical protein